MPDENTYSPISGDLINHDGQISNLVTLLGGEPGEKGPVAPESYSPRSGRIIGADGRVYDLASLVQNALNNAVRLDANQTLTNEQKERVLQKLGIGQLVEKTGRDLASELDWEYGAYYSGNGDKRRNAAFSCTRIAVMPGDTLLFSGFLASDNLTISAFSNDARVQYWSGTTFVSAPVSGMSNALRSYSLLIPEGVDGVTVAVWFNTPEDIRDNVILRIRRSVCEISLDSENIRPVNLTEKRWVSYGDSITYQNGWQPFLAAKYGLVHTNLGVGSCCITNRGATAMCTAARLQTVMDANPDVVTILGGANDLVFVDSGQVSIGTDAELAKALTDKDLSTFYGAYGYIIETLLAWKPILRIVVMGMYYAHADGTAYSQSTTYTDFSNAAREIARYYSLPFVDLHGEAGFNAFTMGASPNAVYATDRIHPNAAGCKRIAECVDPVFAAICKYE